jgi:hypothetical protein
MKVVYEQNDAGSTLTGFMFFVTVSDEDGPEDLAELRLYNDNEGLMWVVKSDSWISIEERGRTWVGSKEFRPAGSEALPSGQYRAVIADKSGETGEKTFGFDAPSESPYRFPTFTINDGNYTATSAYPENYLLMFFEDGAYRNVTKLSNMSGTVASLRLPSDVYSVALWADDSAKAVSALTKKIYIRNN